MIVARSAGVDLIIGGHDEHLLAFYDGKVALRNRSLRPITW